MSSRQSVERGLVQGDDEQIVWSVITTPWGGTPTSVEVKAFDVNDAYEDVTSTVLSGSPSVDGDVITLPTLKSLTINAKYKIDVKFTAAGNIQEMFFIIRAQR